MASRVVITLLLGASVSGCGAGGGLLGGGAATPTTNPAATPGGAAAPVVTGETLGVYLQTMRDLVEGDPVVQADTFMSAAEAARFEPTTTNRLNCRARARDPGTPVQQSDGGATAVERSARGDQFVAAGRANPCASSLERGRAKVDPGRPGATPAAGSGDRDNAREQSERAARCWFDRRESAITRRARRGPRKVGCDHEHRAFH